MTWRARHKAQGLGALLLSVTFSCAAQTQLPDTLHLAATDWCPYSCAEHAGQPGIVAEYLTEILAREQIDLTLSFLPWGRAVVEAERGALDGLLTAVVDEAPTLAFPRHPVGQYQDCLYTRPDSEWAYQGVDSLTHKQLGVVQGYGYTEQINRYIDSATDAQVTALRGVNSTARLWDMLLLERFDVFIEEQLVVQWQAQRQQRNLDSLRVATCLAPQPFYLALYPGRKYTDELLKRLDRAFSAQRNVALWQKIQARYLPQAETAALK
ncbi:transporter substrate-binding domain-containing protein [uncultured Gilvimarinus sp.]|uniref:substrate-binding periplasmic protein n=1 Tax=uncultured Gilvimarinus sp. TaxID=1689143 RepID=UPI0030DC893B